MGKTVVNDGLQDKGTEGVVGGDVARDGFCGSD